MRASRAKTVKVTCGAVAPKKILMMGGRRALRASPPALPAGRCGARITQRVSSQAEPGRWPKASVPRAGMAPWQVTVSDSACRCAGGTRFIGLYLARQLIEEGHQVTLYTRGKKPIATQIPDDTASSFDRFSRNIKHIAGDRMVSRTAEPSAGQAGVYGEAAGAPRSSRRWLGGCSSSSWGITTVPALPAPCRTLRTSRAS
jgi:hypothetical protein